MNMTTVNCGDRIANRSVYVHYSQLHQQNGTVLSRRKREGLTLKSQLLMVETALAVVRVLSGLISAG